MRIWLAIGILGVVLAVAHLVARFAFGHDSFLGLHVHMTTIIEGELSRQDVVIPALVGAVLALVGFTVFFALRRRSVGHP